MEPLRSMRRQSATMPDDSLPSAQSDSQVDYSTEPSYSLLGFALMGEHAERQCFFRALNSQMPASHRVVYDPMAYRLLRFRTRLFLGLLRFGGLEQYVALQLDRRWPGGLIYGALRSRMIDEMLEARLRRRYEQVVILGAGLQTRSLRTDLFPPGMVVFEVDWPEAQEEKQFRIERAFGKLPEHVRFAACDMTNGELVSALGDEGFDPKARTIFLWEGGTFSLAGDQVERVLQGIHEATVPGSVLIFDFMDGSVVYGERDLPGSAEVIAHLASLGVAPRFGIRPGKEAAYLKRRGFRHRRTYGPADFTIWLDTHPFYRALTIPQLWYICESIVE